MLIVAVEHNRGTATRVHYANLGMPLHMTLGLLDYVRNALLGFFNRSSSALKGSGLAKRLPSFREDLLAAIW